MTLPGSLLQCTMTLVWPLTSQSTEAPEEGAPQTGEGRRGEGKGGFAQRKPLCVCARDGVEVHPHGDTSFCMLFSAGG